MMTVLLASSPCTTVGSLSPISRRRRDDNLRCLVPLTASPRLRGIGAMAEFRSTRPKVALSGNSDAARVPVSVPVRVAHELLQAGHRYLDVRTPEEFSAGHVPEAINIPYMYRAGPGMTKNLNFLSEVASRFRKDDEIIVGCRSGKRSLMAAADLLAAGFTGVTDIAGGYEAWTENGLPAEL